MSLQVQTYEVEPTTGLTIFDDTIAPFRVITQATGAETIKNLGGASEFVRPVMTNYMNRFRIGLAELVEAALIEFEDLKSTHSVPVCNFEYGLIDVDSIRHSAPKGYLHDLDFQGIHMPRGLQLAAKVEVIPVFDTSELSEEEEADFLFEGFVILKRASEYSKSCETKSGYRLSDVDRSSQFVTSENFQTLVDIEPRISR
ncbi:MAG: hypothetical protein M3Q70_01425 [bacterium]|nr:hypothetical protein [bacterium]